MQICVNQKPYFEFLLKKEKKTKVETRGWFRIKKDINVPKI